MKNLILLITLLIALGSCRSPQQIADRKCAKAQAKYEKAAYRWGCDLSANTDSTSAETNTTVVKDTTIYIPVPGETKTDTITIKLTNGLLNSKESRLDTKYAYATVQVVDGKLIFNLYQKESVIAATLKGAIRYNNITKYYKITKTLPGKITNILTQWQVAQMWLGRILLVVMFVYGVFRALKFYLKV